MRNVTTKVEGSKLIITVDLAAPTQKSSSGKSDVLASTEGNKIVSTVDGRSLFLGLNAYLK
jgi:hypothetical protein